MSANNFLSFVDSQMHAGTFPPHTLRIQPRLAVTISRQAGCGAQEVAEKLAARLRLRLPEDGVPWTVFDRNLMDKVLEEHRLPKHLSIFLPEDRKPAVEDMLEDIFGLHPPQEVIIKQTAETILRLAERGNVIVIGRAGNIVTAKVPHVLHVRLVAPLDQRIEHAHLIYRMSHTEARNFCLREDLGRTRYIRKYFHADISDPLLYHLVINTGLIDYPAAAKLIEEAVLDLAAKQAVAGEAQTK